MKNATELHKAYSLGLEDVSRDAKELERHLSKAESMIDDVITHIFEADELLQSIESEAPNLEEGAPYGFRDILTMLREADSDATNAMSMIQDAIDATEKMGLQ